ncbi:MAG TPA: tetratricopeptide repeat protein [bacterium]|nr:tetratricopeptide repeat protein [bacterium]HNS48662.1 tetratricopeptide repeat protein [bacterium]
MFKSQAFHFRIAGLFCLALFLSASILKAQEKPPLLTEAQALIQKKDYAGAVERLERLVKLVPDDPETRYYLATALLAQKQAETARPHLEFYLEKGPVAPFPRFNETYRNLVSFYRDKKLPEEVIRVSHLFRNRVPPGDRNIQYSLDFAAGNESSARRELGEKAFSTKLYQVALEHFLAAEQLGGNKRFLWDRIARCYRALARLPEARKAYLLAIRLADKDWSYRFNTIVGLAGILVSTGDWEAAAKELADDPDGSEALKIARLAISGRAAAAFEEAVGVDSRFNQKGELVGYLVRSLVSDDLVPDTGKEGMLYAYLKRYPTGNLASWSVNNLQRFYRQAPGRENAGREAVTRLINDILAAHPGNPEVQKFARRVVDELWWEWGRRPGGQRDDRRLRADLYARIRQACPDGPVVADLLRREARMRLDDGDYRTAGDLYRELVERYNDRNSIPQLVEAVALAGDPARAAGLLKDFLDKQPAPEERYQVKLGQYYLMAGLVDQGLAWLTRVRERTSRDEIRNQVYNLVKDYREVIPGQEPLPDTGLIVLFLESASRRSYFTNSVSLEKGSPLIFQQVEELQVYPFAAGTGECQFGLDFTASKRPVLAEPYAIIRTEGENFTGHWPGQAAAGPHRWREPAAVYRLLFPWQEVPVPAVEARRSYSRVGTDTMLVEIEVRVPGPGWRVTLEWNRRVGRLQNITPQPDVSEGDRLVYESVPNVFRLKLEGRRAGNPDFYYPRLLVGRYESETRTPGTRGRDLDFRLPSGTGYRLESGRDIVFRRGLIHSETVYELEEKLEPR